jgi:hypothetical protein
MSFQVMVRGGSPVGKKKHKSEVTLSFPQPVAELDMELRGLRTSIMLKLLSNL